jgi:serine/threonine-protein kinase haspin
MKTTNLALTALQHRDLHEGNVCVKRIKPATILPQNQRHKFSYSGLQITLLDYTLSRASQSGITRWRDLEQDDMLFAESAQLQHQMYRR